MSERGLLHPERLETPLRELMTPGVVAVPGAASLRRVFDALRCHRVHAVLVVEGAAPLGWVTSRALLAHATADLALRTARDAIDEPAVTLSPSATAGDAIERMLAEGVGRVAVGHDPAVLPEGIVTSLDLVGLLARRG